MLSCSQHDKNTLVILNPDCKRRDEESAILAGVKKMLLCAQHDKYIVILNAVRRPMWRTVKNLLS